MFKNNKKKGFSLVELIVVIAILAVIAVVLIPALLSYVENSRASKDIKTTDELVTAVDLALADQDVYDEMLEHSVLDNISCYVDKNREVDCDGKEVTKAASSDVDAFEQYSFNDDARKLDETPYFGAGNMRGVTITFSPEKSSNTSKYVLKDGIINKMVGRITGYVHENGKIYSAIRSVMGDEISLNSQTYRNSDFTIFIRMGTTGANDAANQDAVVVYGQFNGTNLPNDKSYIHKLTSDRIVGDNGSKDLAVNTRNNDVEYGTLDFGENSLMGSGSMTGNGSSGAIQVAPEEALVGTAYAVYSEDDHSLTFMRSETTLNVGDTINGKIATAVYPNIDKITWATPTDCPWYTPYAEKITSVKTQDWVKPISMQFWFTDFKNCSDFDLTKLDTTEVTTMRAAFGHVGYNCNKLYLNLVGLDVSKVTEMRQIFQGIGYAAGEVNLNLSGWKTSSLKSMDRAFQNAAYNAKSFKVNMAGWDTSKVENMYGVFNQAGYNSEVFNLGNLGLWDTSNVTTMYQMFRYTGYAKTTTWYVGDLSRWDVSKVTDMGWMFCNAGVASGSFDIGNIEGWNVSNVTRMTSMFYQTNIEKMNMSNWNLANVTDMEWMFYKCKKMTEFSAQNVNALKVENVNSMFYDCENIEKINMSGFSAITGLQFTFRGCVKLESIDVSGINTSNCIDFIATFQNNSSLKEIKGIETWDTSKGKSFEEMFRGCPVEELNLSNFDTRNADETYIPENINYNGTWVAIKGMFRGMNYLKKIILGPNFSLNGDGNCAYIEFPTPNPEYITGADGKWYSVTTGTSYEPNKLPDDTADTYVAVNPN